MSHATVFSQISVPECLSEFVTFLHNLLLFTEWKGWVENLGVQFPGYDGVYDDQSIKV